MQPAYTFERVKEGVPCLPDIRGGPSPKNSTFKTLVAGGSGSPDGSNTGPSLACISEERRPRRTDCSTPWEGRLAEDILLTLRLNEDELKTYDTVRKKSLKVALCLIATLSMGGRGLTQESQMRLRICLSSISPSWPIHVIMAAWERRPYLG